MNKYISTSLYLDYLKCPKNAWLKLHRKEELRHYFNTSEFSQHIIEQGQRVESLAQQLFPQGVLLDVSAATMLQDTLGYIVSKSPVLFQPSFMYDSLFARGDVLQYDAAGDRWNLYEIKSGNDIGQYVEDAVFQALVIEALGIKIGRICIITLNRDYVLEGEIVLNDLFRTVDITADVHAQKSFIKHKIAQAQTDLLYAHGDDLKCMCIYKGRSSHCETFRFSHPHVPEYSVYDVSRIGLSKKKLTELVDRQLIDIMDIPLNFGLSVNQNNQIKAAQQQAVIIDSNAIKQELDTLTYPLYFLDYETFSAAIPRYKGFSPHSHITFQLSLHVVHNQTSEPVHYEYLHEYDTDPSLALLDILKKNIGPKGSVIVWYKPFERGRNDELGMRHPRMKAFLENINSRIYDLMDIFSKQLYVHPDFRGSASIKSILPVLVPNVSHKKLPIQEGAQASLNWFTMVAGSLSLEAQQTIAKNLRQYCALDTYAMYAIWKHLHDVVAQYKADVDAYKERSL